jgi:DNA polymerase-3 subunit gamma/tau
MTDAPTTSAPPADAAAPAAPYRVLARKYRPRTFADLMGQEALVRTLTNAIRSGRLHQAYMLTGVRGVGKTTTARIIARALNCVGPDGTGGPTTDPCGVCDNCVAILSDRHVDVLEMDAASNTGVDNIREIIESARLAPMRARYKVYIVDEVHMLSKGAFNALLKTLEEPPEHVKFVFATTEIRKVPVTVLSRCQRFDLRRLDSDTLSALFAKVAAAEGIPVEPEAVRLLVRAADGSARDGLSLLDQAMALSAGAVTGEGVRDMLGLADRQRIFDLFEAAMGGRPADALAVLGDLHRVGADPVVVVQDLLDLVHGLTRLRLIPALKDDPATPEAERTRGVDLAEKLTIPVLTRAWQMLLKGLGEVQAAPVPQQAAEMAVIRLAYAADLPTPGDLVRQLSGGGAPASAPAAPPKAPAPGGGGPRLVATPPPAPPPAAIAVGEAPAPPSPPAPAPASAAAEATSPVPRDFPGVVALFRERREALLAAELRNSVHLVRYEPGLIEIRPAAAAPRDLANKVGEMLGRWTGRRWIVTVSSAPGAPTLRQQEEAAGRAVREEVVRHPAVLAVMEAFPGARILEVRDLEPLAPEPAAADLGTGIAAGDDTGETAYPADPDEEGEL